MNNKILDLRKIEQASVQVRSRDRMGSAFFVAVHEQKQMLLTSDHVLVDGKSIILYINEAEIKADIVERIPVWDVAILAVELQSIENIVALPLKKKQIAYNELWETFGFPVQRIAIGGRYYGQVSRINGNTKWDIDLECNQYNSIDDFSGLSGSALVIDGFAVGVIGYDNVGTLGATSINNITEILIKHRVAVTSDNTHTIPDSILSDISGITPNDDVIEEVYEIIANEKNSGYFLISGTPGSGKTTIAAQLEMTGKYQVLIDRFFVKVPENEEYPTQIRATPDFFMNWLESVCYRTLYNSAPPKPTQGNVGSNKILEIYQLIKELSTYYARQSKTGFLIIDGLDDVGKNRIEEYLGVLPITLPPNINVIFCCTSKEILPISFQNVINDNKNINVTPLPIQQTEKYLTDQLIGKGIKASQITELATRSEGHPLYLKYLVNFIKAMDNMPSINDWIQTIPKIGGEIENYYNKLWSQIDSNPDELWLAGTLSRLRVSVDATTLSMLVPEMTRHNFLSSFKKIQHLLRDDKSISIYHTSFSDFVNEKTFALSEQFHKNIASFVKKNPQSPIGITERVYHLANADEQDKRLAIDECNQHWIDDCALNSVNPDIVLADLKNITALAAELGISHKVISLLLLSQRVNFRYNTLFQENAIFLVNALLALNKPEEAIRYVVRNKTLITSDGDALYLLQKFYEYEADNEADILLETINQTCLSLVEKGVDTNNFNRYINLKFSALTLSSNSDFEKAFREWERVKRVVIKIIESSDNTKDVVIRFKDDIGSYNTGYLIWRFGIPPILKKIEEEFEEITLDERTSGFIALSIYQSFQFQEKSLLREGDDGMAAWIEDIEYLIDKYGTHEDYHFVQLYVLLGKSKRLDIIERLYKQLFSEFETFDIRKENGVELDHQKIHKLTLYAQCLGFFDTTNQFPLLPKYTLTYNNWEEGILELFKYLFFVHGKVKRLRIDERSSDIETLQPYLINFITKLIPDLNYRINWERSYGLPELIYPIIYKSLIDLLVDAFPIQIEGFVGQISNQKYYQLGLYTEGYIDSLFVVARELAKKSNYDVYAFKVAKVLEEYVVKTVENRSERNEYLLRLVEIYALLENHDRAGKVFEEMVNSSMGPSWYKEAQLGIINSTVANIIPDNESYTYLQKFAAHFDFASGEMTFQRYVKQQQEEFAGNLVKMGFLDKSIEYLKYLLMPDYQTVINNAESSKVDMPAQGKGYLLGARAIEEQSAVLEILLNLGYKESLVAWALSELCIIGDDRYISGYAKVQGGIINNLEKKQSEKLDSLFKRLSRFVITEICEEYRHSYLDELFSELNLSNFEKIKPYLKSVRISAFQKKQDTNDKTEESPVAREQDPLDKLVPVKQSANKKLAMENKTGARETIIQALQDVQTQKYSIWSFNYSNKINNLRELLSDSYTNSNEFIKDIKTLIINEPYNEECIIADQIIKLLRNINEDQEKLLILDSVLEHIDLMIRTPQSFLAKYSWLNKKSDKNAVGNQDDKLIKLLIWFLNHPSIVVKNRTIEILTWLGSIETSFVVEALINEILGTEHNISRELSASIIHQLSDLNPLGFSEVLITCVEKNELALLGQQHFMIKYALLSALKTANKSEGTNIENLITKFEKTFVVDSKSKGEVIIEEEYIEPIHVYLDELNELGILNTPFAKKLFEEIRKLAPLSIINCRKASDYIDRSFNNHNNSLVSEFDTILRHALNLAISVCTTIENSEKVASVIRFYQPTFPENKLVVYLKDDKEQLETAVKSLFETNKFDIKKMLLEDRLPLHYFSSEHFGSQARPSEKIELSTYLIPLNKFNKKGHTYPWPTFPANSYPSEANDENEENVLPLFIISEYADNVTGSELVPAVLNTKITKLVPGIESKIKSTYWRNGRNWNNTQLGVAQKTGYFSFISNEVIEELKPNFKLVWQISFNYKFKYIDLFEQKEL